MRQWEDADDLAVGELVLTADGVVVPVTSVVDLAMRRVLPAHNLTVDDIHTYYVLAGHSGSSCLRWGWRRPLAMRSVLSR